MLAPIVDSVCIFLNFPSSVLSSAALIKSKTEMRICSRRRAWHDKIRSKSSSQRFLLCIVFNASIYKFFGGPPFFLQFEYTSTSFAVIYLRIFSSCAHTKSVIYYQCYLLCSPCILLFILSVLLWSSFIVISRVSDPIIVCYLLLPYHYPLWYFYKCFVTKT